MREPSARRIPISSLWFGLIGPPVVWSVHLLAVWLVVEVGCALGLAEILLIGVNGVHALVLLSTLTASVITVASGVVAYQNWRQLQQTLGQSHETEAREIGRGRFMSVVGMSFSALFLLVIVYMTIPVFVLSAC